MKARKVEKKDGRGGYRGPRDGDGIATPTTPRQLLDWRKAELAQIELEVARGELVRIEDVQRSRQSDAEVIKSALLQTLPAKIAAHAAALGCDQAALREVVRTEATATLTEMAGNL